MISVSLRSLIPSFSKCLTPILTSFRQNAVGLTVGHWQFCLDKHRGRHCSIQCTENCIYGQEGFCEASQGEGLVIPSTSYTPLHFCFMLVFSRFQQRHGGKAANSFFNSVICPFLRALLHNHMELNLV